MAENQCKHATASGSPSTYSFSKVAKMKIDLDDKWCITSSNHCNVILVKKSGRLQKDGTPAGQKFYYQSFGQEVMMKQGQSNTYVWTIRKSECSERIF